MSVWWGPFRDRKGGSGLRGEEGPLGRTLGRDVLRKMGSPSYSSLVRLRGRRGLFGLPGFVVFLSRLLDGQ